MASADYPPGVAFVPFVEGRLRDETIAAVVRDAQRRQVPATAVKLHDDQAYSRLLVHLFERGRPFVIVEQDVVPHDGAIAELFGCPEAWCAFPYEVGNRSRAYLGFSKFDPGRLGRVSLHAPWAFVDLELEAQLEHAGWSVHVHAPAVPHLHDQERPPSDRILSVRGRIAALRGT